MGGMVMLALLALQSAWQAWRVPAAASHAADELHVPRTGNPTGDNAMSALILVVFLGAAVAAVPIAHALLLAAMAAAATTDRVPLDLLVQQMVAQVQSFPLIAIPFFMLTGALMMGGRLGEAIVGTLTALVGRLARRAGAGERPVVDAVRRRLRLGGGRRLGDRRAADALAQEAGLSDGVLGRDRWPRPRRSTSSSRRRSR